MRFQHQNASSDVFRVLEDHSQRKSLSSGQLISVNELTPGSFPAELTPGFVNGECRKSLSSQLFSASTDVPSARNLNGAPVGEPGPSPAPTSLEGSVVRAPPEPAARRVEPS